MFQLNFKRSSKCNKLIFRMTDHLLTKLPCLERQVVDEIEPTMFLQISTVDDIVEKQ